MATLRDIQRRIRSVKNTQQITKAMKMVAAAKLRRAQEDSVAARPYANKLTEMTGSLSASSSPEANPFFRQAEQESKVELILMTSDRGLCGGFNAQLTRMADKFIKDNPEAEVELNLIGKRAFDHFKNKSIEVINSMPIGGGRPEHSLASKLAQDATERFLKEEVDAVYIIYSEFQSALTQTPVLQKILPITAPGTEEEAEGTEKSAKGAGEPEKFVQSDKYLFEPSQEELLESILPKFVEVLIYRALLETSASEHGARMTAMDAASRSASDMIASLTLIYNRARQAAITKELMEIIGGAEALK